MSSTDGQLRRSQDDAIVGGVCAGLGDYFDVDITLVRALFIAASAVGGFGPALYIALWLMLDDSDVNAKKASTVAHSASPLDEVDADADAPPKSGRETDLRSRRPRPIGVQ